METSSPLTSLKEAHVIPWISTRKLPQVNVSMRPPGAACGTAGDIIRLLAAVKSVCCDCGNVSGRVLVEQGQEAPHLLVVTLNVPGEDVVVPAVDADCVVGHGARNGGLGFQIEQLCDYVSADQGG